MLLFLFASLLLLRHPPVLSLPLDPHLLPNHCDEKCGNLQIPFPFHLNASCATISAAFRLSCFNSTILLLNTTSSSYRVLEFFSDGLLLDFPGPSCRQYNDLKSFRFPPNASFGISADNVVGLYDCDDSSLCKTDCEKVKLVSCDGNGDESPACCYPLDDRRVWGVGDDFSVFGEFGCRGFSSWFVGRGWNAGKRGVKVEWGVARSLSSGMCDENADVVNATAIEGAVRCSCREGFVGDGFAKGFRCLKSCIKDGKNVYGSDCHVRRHSERKLVIFTGVLAPLFILASLIGLFCILKRPIKQSMLDSDRGQFPSNTLLQKACRTRLFTYHELEEATRGFRDEGKLVVSRNGAIFAGDLGDGSRVAVHRLQCGNEGDLIDVLSQIEVLHAVAHKNVARILGCCIDSGRGPMVVYEHPANGTLETHLHHQKGKEQTLDWFTRLKIAAETASVLAFLQYEVSPPIIHRNLESGHIFLDADFSAKVAGFKPHLLEEASSFHANDVYDFGVVLLEMITGVKNSDGLPMAALQKIRSGKMEEVVDPSLYYHEQPARRREEIEIVADLGTRCLLFGGEGKLRMVDVAKELIHIVKESIDGGRLRGNAIEETFSNSSLLQMISMSPDSILVP